MAPRLAVCAATSVSRRPGGAPAPQPSSPRTKQSNLQSEQLRAGLAPRGQPCGGGGAAPASARLTWTVPRYLASADPVVYGVGLTFVRRTFGLCVACFGLTCALTGGLLLLWGRGLEHLVFDDACTRATHWSCAQWAVDGVLVLIIIPLKFCYGMARPWTRLLLLLLAVFQSANLALIGCYTRGLTPLAIQTYVTFWLARRRPPAPRASTPDSPWIGPKRVPANALWP